MGSNVSRLAAACFYGRLGAGPGDPRVWMDIQKRGTAARRHEPAEYLRSVISTGDIKIQEGYDRRLWLKHWGKALGRQDRIWFKKPLWTFLTGKCPISLNKSAVSATPKTRGATTGATFLKKYRLAVILPTQRRRGAAIL